MEHSPEPVENELITPQQLAEFALQSAGVTDGPVTFPQGAEVLRIIKFEATKDIQKGVDYDVFSAAVSHAVDLTGDPFLTAAGSQLRRKLQVRDRATRRGL